MKYIALILVSITLVACAGKPSEIDMLRSNALDISTTYPELSTCLGERARDYDKGLTRCSKQIEHAKKLALLK
jgi:hypothetical protein